MVCLMLSSLDIILILSFLGTKVLNDLSIFFIAPVIWIPPLPFHWHKWALSKWWPLASANRPSLLRPCSPGGLQSTWFLASLSEFLPLHSVSALSYFSLFQDCLFFLYCFRWLLFLAPECSAFQQISLNSTCSSLSPKPNFQFWHT